MQGKNYKTGRITITKIVLLLLFLALLTFQLCRQPATKDNLSILEEQCTDVSDVEYSDMKNITLDLLNNQPLVTLVTINLYGYPEARVMGNLYPQLIAKKALGANSLDTYFAGNIHTDKVKHIRNNPKASIYISDNATFKAVTLTGTLAIIENKRDKEAVWDDRFLGMYPDGPGDSNFCCFKFDARTLKIHRGADSPTVLIKK